MDAVYDATQQTFLFTFTLYVLTLCVYGCLFIDLSFHSPIQNAK